jgi:uncharacterized membrane protein YfcA
MDLLREAFLVGSAAAAGAINSVAGGGTLLSFPAAMAAGLSPLVANATNAVAMTPGSLAAAWGYRRELRDKGRLTAWLAVPTAVGGVLGAWILRHTGPVVFEVVIPWLVLGATLVILLQTVGVRAFRGVAPAERGPAGRGRIALVVGLQLLVGIYGGYFGGAMGIVMLAFLTLLGGMQIHQMNAVKNVLAALVNGCASLYFIARGMVDARAALLMAAGAVLGGFAGARVARRIEPGVVRWLVIAIGLGLAVLLGVRHYAAGR